jgi:signal transduction histidine kinase
MCNRSFTITRCLRLLAGLVLAGLSITLTRAETVELQPGHGIEALAPYLRYLPAYNTSLETVLKRFRAGELSRNFATLSYGPNYAPETWAAVDVVNASLDDGRGPDSFAAVLDMPLVSGAQIYLVRQNGLTENLLDYSIFDNFDPAEHAVTRLRTSIFTIAAQEKVTLVVHLQIGPLKTFHLSLETPEELEASNFTWGVKETAFYAFSIACLIYFFGFQFAMKNWIGVYFSGLFSAFLAMIAYVDGLLFRFFYPLHPEWQSAVGFFILFLLSGMGFLSAGNSLVVDGHYGKAAKGLSLMALLSLAGYVVSLFSPGPLTLLYAYILIGLMMVAVVATAIIWRRAGDDMQTGPLIIAGLSLLGVAGVLIIFVMGWGGAIFQATDALKTVFAFLLLATMTMLTSNVMRLRRKHSEAIQSRIEALEAEAEKSRQLLAAERNYTHARDLAAMRQRQLATASHDLKQPLTSLRMTFDTIAADMEPRLQKRLHEAFDYMEALSKGYLDETTPAGDEPSERVISAGGNAGVKEETDPYPIAVVLGTVHQMFNEEAVSKGLKLRIVESSLNVRTPPIVLMRILGNLVSNAVKYTEQGAVLIGVRHADAPRICVLDTGPGLSSDEIVQFRQAYVKGKASDGHGLGLSVCYELSEKNGLRLDVRSRKGKGTAFALTLPHADK